jgi:hypothetical protein
MIGGRVAVLLLKATPRVKRRIEKIAAFGVKLWNFKAF